MRGNLFVPRATRGLLAVMLGLGAMAAHANEALDCNAYPSCSFSTPHVVAQFDPAPGGYGGMFDINGMQYTYTDHANIDYAISPGSEGFSFETYHGTSTGLVEATPTGYYTYPGGSIDLTLYNINFVAKDGWRIDSLQLEITATTFVSGSGSASVDFDAGGQTTTSTDAATGTVTHLYTRTFGGNGTGDIHVGLNSAVDDSQGVATARAALTGFKVTAHISAVPEPSTWALVGIGGAVAAGWARRGRKG